MNIIVVSSEASEKDKERADFICDGVNDEIELAASLNAVTSPNSKIEWLPGRYQLDAVLDFPANLPDCVIDAKATRFDFTHPEQDGIVFHGAIRSRFDLGYITMAGSGGAIVVYPTINGWAENILTWRGLTGTSRQGIGLRVMNGNCGASVSEFKGSDISGFAAGVSIEAEGGKTNIDTNQFLINYIRNCNKSIHVGGGGGSTVNSSTWRVNFEASSDGDIGLETNGKYDIWQATVFGAPGGTIIRLDPGAQENQFQITPGPASFPGSTFIQNNSGNKTNTYNGIPIQ